LSCPGRGTVSPHLLTLALHLNTLMIVMTEGTPCGGQRYSFMLLCCEPTRRGGMSPWGRCPLPVPHHQSELTPYDACHEHMMLVRQPELTSLSPSPSLSQRTP